ncbi:MAG: TonB family protein [Cytophagaceae bacterium]|jgi:protein TonB|nr:TonB family protein [Cytophagaceae bacterium]
MEERNLSNLTLDDLVFENRNKSYGSYELRTKYGIYTVRAFAIAIAFFLLLAFSPKISAWIESLWGTDTAIVKEQEIEVLAVIEDIPIEKDIPPPPPVKVDPPKIESVKFLPPEIKPDNQVKEVELPPVVKDLDSVKISSVTQDGDKDIGEMIEDSRGNSELGKEDNTIYTYVGEWPEFPGGNAERNKFLSKHLVYPRDAERKGIEGRVIIGFTVEKTGEIVDVKILKGVSESMDNEAMRVVKMMPKWKPGKNNGVAVRTRHKVDVVYKLPE